LCLTWHAAPAHEPESHVQRSGPQARHVDAGEFDDAPPVRARVVQQRNEQMFG
jgi:hypothetical protein